MTGLYSVIWPDGSETLNGMKIFNSAHEFGDVVQVTSRSDGILILDGVKAAAAETVTTAEISLKGFGEKPVGYLNGQVFNNEDEVVLPIVSIEFAPGSLEELAPGAGNFVVRIKIDRPQRKDLRVKLKFTGTAIAADYTIAGLAADSPTVPIIIIPAGADFADITITPVSSVDSTKTIVVTALQLREYRIGQDNSVTATIASESSCDRERDLFLYQNSYGINQIYFTPPSQSARGQYITNVNTANIFIPNDAPYSLTAYGRGLYFGGLTWYPGISADSIRQYVDDGISVGLFPPNVKQIDKIVRLPQSCTTNPSYVYDLYLVTNNGNNIPGAVTIPW